MDFGDIERKNKNKCISYFRVSFVNKYSSEIALLTCTPLAHEVHMGVKLRSGSIVYRANRISRRLTAAKAQFALNL